MQSNENESNNEERLRLVMTNIEARLRKLMREDPGTLDQIEASVDEVGDFIKEEITKEIVSNLGAGYQGSRIDCAVCRSRAKYCGTRSREVITLHGRLKFNRAYYYCKVCRSSLCPTDKQLGLGRDDCSRTVKAYSARVASYLPFAVAAKELKALRRIDISATKVQENAKEIGNRIGKEWDQLAEDVSQGKTLQSEQAPTHLFQAMDAAKCHVGGEWRDAKLSIVYQRSADGAISFADYYASLERSVDFGWRSAILAQRWGADNCQYHQMLGDGADWIWGETTKHHPKAIQTLDFYHACEHLQHVADTRFKTTTPEGAQWIDTQKIRLRNDEIGEVMKDIASWRTRSKSKSELKRRVLAYLEKHQGRMNYKTLKDQGYDIGSGLIEAGCKTVIKTRMGGAGMRWKEEGASAVLHLSAFWRSSRSPNFMQYT